MNDDTTLFATIRAELFTAVVGDVLDVMGAQRQFLPPSIKPLDPRTVLVGRAMPVLESDYAFGEGPGAGEPFGLMFEALDSLLPGEIYIATGASLTYALWGGLMSTRAQHLGAAGAILDGFVRDSEEIARLSFPVFAQGLYAQDQAPRGKVTDYRCPIHVDTILVKPGDLIFGDCEGVLVVPREVESEAILRALEKARTESAVAKAIKDGMSASDAFRNFGVM